MEADNEILQLRFDGNDINPDKVKPSEICDIIYEMQNALLETIKKDYPEVDITSVLFSLDGIKNDSLGINLKALRTALSQISGAVVSSFILIATSISTNDMSKLNSSAVQSLKKIVAFSKTYGCNGEFNYNGQTLSIITPNTVLKEIKIPTIRSSVKIYGEIVDVGNNIHVKVNEGYNVIVETDKMTCKKLAHKLWENVGLRGNAKWDIESFKITEFKLTDILDYNPGSVAATFNDLKNLSSGWDNFNSNDDITKQLFRD